MKLLFREEKHHEKEKDKRCSVNASDRNLDRFCFFRDGRNGQGGERIGILDTDGEPRFI